MRQNVRFLFVVLLIVATMAFAWRALLGGQSPTSSAAERTPLPGNPASDPYVTPGPTFTPIPAPQTATLKTIDQAHQMFLDAAKGYGIPDDSGSISAVSGRAADFGTRFQFLSPDYPIWIVTGTGTFHARSSPSGSGPLPTLTQATLIFDAARGYLLGADLTGPTPTPTAAP